MNSEFKIVLEGDYNQITEIKLSDFPRIPVKGERIILNYFERDGEKPKSRQEFDEKGPKFIFSVYKELPAGFEAYKLVDADFCEFEVKGKGSSRLTFDFSSNEIVVYVKCIGGGNDAEYYHPFA